MNGQIYNLNVMLKSLNYLNVLEETPTRESASHLLLATYYTQPRLVKIIDNHQDTAAREHYKLKSEIRGGMYGPLNKSLIANIFYLKPTQETINFVYFVLPQSCIANNNNAGSASKVEYEETKTATKKTKTIKALKAPKAWASKELVID